MLKTQIRPGSVVLLHDTYSSTVDLVYQFLPVLRANGYHLVTVSHLLGSRAPGSSYGGRENGLPANDITDIPPAVRVPVLSATPPHLNQHRTSRSQISRTKTPPAAHNDWGLDPLLALRFNLPAFGHGQCESDIW